MLELLPVSGIITPKKFVAKCLKIIVPFQFYRKDRKRGLFDVNLCTVFDGKNAGVQGQ